MRVVIAILLTGMLLCAQTSNGQGANRAVELNGAAKYTAGDKPWEKCQVVESVEPVLEIHGAPYYAEFRRCEGEQPLEGAHVYPVSWFLLWRDKTKSVLVYEEDNADEPSISALTKVERVRMTGESSDQIRLHTTIYGTGSMWDECVLTIRDGKPFCWDEPQTDPRIIQRMKPDEKMNKVVQISFAAERMVIAGLLYAPRDPNCCPSRGMVCSEWIPDHSRFKLGRIWRSPPAEGANQYCLEPPITNSKKHARVRAAQSPKETSSSSTPTTTPR